MTTDAGHGPVLVVGAHAFDAEVLAGGTAAARARQGGRVVLLHLTLGEGGHSSKSLDDYRKQKRAEAEEAARILGAEAVFGGETDTDLGSDRRVAEIVATQIRSVRPETVITHWRGSWHPDHVAAHHATMRGLLLAGLPSGSDGKADGGADGKADGGAGGKADGGVDGKADGGADGDGPRAHVASRVLFGENWEDSEGFRPEVYEDISQDFDTWQAALAAYEIGSPSSAGFPYRDYYTALARLRGCIWGVRYAEAFHSAPVATMRGLALPSPVWDEAR
jgi:N-acetylglucosamine malate deacetylase 1